MDIRLATQQELFFFCACEMEKLVLLFQNSFRREVEWTRKGTFSVVCTKYRPGHVKFAAKYFATFVKVLQPVNGDRLVRPA